MAADTKYSEDHEWIRIEDGVGTVGITDYAQGQLGDVVFVELPDVGKAVAKGEEFAVVESVKAASEVYAPASGEIVAVNDSLGDAPGTVNESPEEAGWFVKIKLSDAAELTALMDKAAYDAFAADL